MIDCTGNCSKIETWKTLFQHDTPDVCTDITHNEYVHGIVRCIIYSTCVLTVIIFPITRVLKFHVL